MLAILTQNYEQLMTTEFFAFRTWSYKKGQAHHRVKSCREACILFHGCCVLILLEGTKGFSGEIILSAHATEYTL